MFIEKIEVQALEAQSADLINDNIAKLKALFPELVTETGIGTTLNVDVLKALIGDATVTDVEEKYGLNWHGKRHARQIALTPSTGTLRPCREESLDWDLTRNLMIEGDNLEVLKLLQKSYAGKVKLIYIDPPYNTGKDFVYPDNFQDNLRNYQQLIKWRDEKGVPVTSLTRNSPVGGRFHTDWLNMMYPRIKLARNLLREDGVLLVSLDDGEIDNLRLLLKEVFGEENFVAQILWKKRSSPPNDKIIGANHDYIALFCKDLDSVGLNLRERSQDQLERYKNPDNHKKGLWAPGDLMANVKGGRYVESLNFPIVNPKTGKSHMPLENGRGNWRFSKETIDKLIANDEIYFGEDGLGRPKLKRFLCDVKDGVTYPTIWDFVPLNTSGSAEMQSLFGNSTVFESPKPVGLIKEIVKLTTSPGDIVLDFFAGSGTTGHAVWEQNVADCGERRFILIQLPEPLDPKNGEQTTASNYCDQLGSPRTICELTKERLRRASAKIKAANPLLLADMGFRVFKLDTSNIRAWNPNQADLTATLFSNLEHIEANRSVDDLLYEVLIKLGLDLCVPIEERNILGKKVHSIGGGTLMTCFDENISVNDAEALALGMVTWREEEGTAGDTTAVFRDSAFENDVAKSNLAAILAQRGIKQVRSL